MISVFQGQYICTIFVLFYKSKVQAEQKGHFSTVIRCKQYMLQRGVVSWKKASSQLHDNENNMSLSSQSIPLCGTWLPNYMVAWISFMISTQVSDEFCSAICWINTVPHQIYLFICFVVMFYARLRETETPSWELKLTSFSPPVVRWGTCNEKINSLVLFQ